jgi:hypothetical protein
LISKFLAKLKQLDITVIMVTPVWRKAVWWDQLQELAMEESVDLGRTTDICRARKGAKLPKMGRLRATVVQEQPHPLSAAAAELLNNDIRTSTKALYESKVRAFAKYCTVTGADPTTCHPNIVINFLAELIREKGLSYQTVCGYRSAIFKHHAGVSGVPLGQLPEIKRLARGIFIEKRPLPRYAEIWDMDKVLSYLEAGPSAADLTDMELSRKTASLSFTLTLSRFAHLMQCDANGL